MKKILVTGGTGFLGAYLLEWLVREGKQVRALRRSNSPMQLVEGVATAVEWIEGDIMDVGSLETAMEGIEAVYHLAAVVSFDPNKADLMKKINVEGTENVVNIALAMGVKRLLHVSSIAAIGRSTQTRQVNEQTKWERSPLNTNYAISKFQAEQEVWRGGAEGLEIAIVNPSVILGSGFWNEGTNGFFNQIWNGLRFFPTGQTGFVDVRDVVRAMVTLMDSGIQQERFILNGENLPFATLLHWIAEDLGKPRPSVKVTPIIQAIAWRLAWVQARLTGKKPFLTRETARNSSLQFVYENDKFSRQFPEFQFTPIRETVRQTAAQFKNSMEKGLPADKLSF